jgi:uncharacterized Zn ribbon protein
MSSKNGLIILLLFPVIGLLVSCLENSEYDEIPYTEDAEILSFSLSNDSISTLANVVFSIDQKNNLIYNHDSMAYLTEIKYKAIVTYTTASGNSVLNVTDGDSTWVKSGDSIDVTKPLKLKSYALGGNTTKTYTFKLNIHQIDPDSVQYQAIATNRDFLQSEEIRSFLFKDNFHTFTKTGEGIKLYSSLNAVDWAETPLHGLPAGTVVRGIKSNGEKLFAYTAAGDYYESTDAENWEQIPLGYSVVSILGYLKLNNGQPQLKEGLSLIVKKDSQNVFAYRVQDEDTCRVGDAAPDSFPVADFASFNNERLKLGYLTLVGGLSSTDEVLNKVWSTADGLYWAELTNTNTGNVFPHLRGANVLDYNGEYWLLNGKLNDGSYNSEVYFSKDGGTTWTLKPEKCRVPENYTKRYGASAIVDGKGVYFYILGGKSENEEFLPEIWKGYLNKQTFNR